MTPSSVKSRKGKIGRLLRGGPQALLRGGLGPQVLGYRWLLNEPLSEKTAKEAGGSYEQLTSERQVNHPLPFNHPDATGLSDERSWFGFAQREVPQRIEGETAVATLPEATLVAHTDDRHNANFGLLDRRMRGLSLREFEVRAWHASALRSEHVTYDAEASWVCERVYHNYSHWLTAHLPKILLLKEQGRLETLVLPERRTPQMAFTLSKLGVQIDDVPGVDPHKPVRFRLLTVFKTDKFRSDLVRRVRTAFHCDERAARGTPIYITRNKARGRTLRNEGELLPMLERYGFRQVAMEDVGLEEQIALMQQAPVVMGPHGAGLTNMIFCPEDTAVIEIADPAYPNPNFYALAAGLGHRYGLVSATSMGEGHPLYKDLYVDPEAVGRALDKAFGG